MLVNFGPVNENCTIDSASNPVCVNGVSANPLVSLCSSSNEVLGIALSGLIGISPVVKQLTSLVEIFITDSTLGFHTEQLFDTLLSLGNLTKVSVVNCQLSGVLPTAMNKFTYLNLADNPNLIGDGTWDGRKLSSGSVSLSDAFCNGNLTYLNLSGDTGLGCYPMCLLASINVTDFAGLAQCNPNPTAAPTLIPPICLQ
jgi:hypothetical protein